MGYDKVVTTLSGEEWLGQASASMAAAVQPYMAWMTTTAAQAEQAAIQARTAAAAYEAALTASVPPPLVAANRAELGQLLSTDVLGQNTATIAANEAQYGEMWAQDATAMYGYAGQSAAATKVTPFTPAPAIANPAAQSAQTAAVTSSAATTAGTAQSTLTQLVSGLPNRLQGLASPLAATSNAASMNPLSEAWLLLTGQSALPTNLGTAVNGYTPFSSLFYNTEGLPYFSVGMGNFGIQMAKTLGLIGGTAPKAAALVPKGLPALGGLLGGGGMAAHATAALGGAGSVGKLSVPATWAGATGPAMSHATAVPVSTVSAAPEASAGPGNLLGGMPLAGAGTGTAGGAGPRYGFKPTVMARPPLGG